VPYGPYPTPNLGPVLSPYPHLQVPGSKNKELPPPGLSPQVEPAPTLVPSPS